LTVEKGRELVQTYENNFYFSREIVFDIFIAASSKSIAHERKVYALLDSFGDIGGFSDAVLPVFKLIMGLYTPNFFFGSVIASLFKVDKSKAVKRRGKKN